MKKIIAAAAGLMIAGTAMATVASAAVEFSGDARARYYFEDKFTDNAVDKFNNRFRMKVKATTAGGSYAITKFRVDNTWGSNGIGDNAGLEVKMENAYIGVPLGCVELTAGRQPLNLTKGYFQDAGLDNVRLKYAQDGTTVVAYYGVIDSFNTTTLSLDKDGNATTVAADAVFSSSTDTFADSEDQLWGIFWAQDWDGNWNTQLGLSYYNYDLNDTKANLAAGQEEDGIVAVATVGGNIADMVDLYVELGFQEEGVDASDNDVAVLDVDDAFGVLVSAGMTFDAFTPTFVAGYADEGFVWDAAVGFMFLGGDGQLSLLGNLGGVETWFAGLSTSYQAMEDLSFTANLAYIDWEAGEQEKATADVDAYYEQDNSGVEFSVQAAYTINDGTMLYARAGVLTLDDDVVYGGEDTAYGAGLSLELSF